MFKRPDSAILAEYQISPLLKLQVRDVPFTGQPRPGEVWVDPSGWDWIKQQELTEVLAEHQNVPRVGAAPALPQRRVITIDLETGTWVHPLPTITGDEGARIAASVLPGWPAEEIAKAYAAYMEDDKPDNFMLTLCGSDHKPVQHRDGKVPWCPKCGRDARGHRPTSSVVGAERRRAASFEEVKSVKGLRDLPLGTVIDSGRLGLLVKRLDGEGREVWRTVETVRPRHLTSSLDLLPAWRVERSDDE